MDQYVQVYVSNSVEIISVIGWKSITLWKRCKWFCYCINMSQCVEGNPCVSLKCTAGCLACGQSGRTSVVMVGCTCGGKLSPRRRKERSLSGGSSWIPRRSSFAIGGQTEVPLTTHITCTSDFADTQHYKIVGAMEHNHQSNQTNQLPPTNI